MHRLFVNTKLPLAMPARRRNYLAPTRTTQDKRRRLEGEQKAGCDTASTPGTRHADTTQHIQVR